MHRADGAGGAILVAATALGLAWVFGAVALHAPGATELRGDVQRSLILRSLNGVLPPSGPILEALNRVDPAPSVNGPSTAVGPPDPRVGSTPAIRTAGESVFKVIGTACGLGVEGSGWMAAPDLIVTNAHVVAGEDDTLVVTQTGASIAASPVLYDPRNDLAVLEVSLGARPLPFAAETQSGASAAVIGYPENGPLTFSPARVGETTEVISQDAYGRGPIQRQISSLRGDVRSGNSGGPLVDTSGRVLATVFAATTTGTRGGFAIPNEIVREALRQSHDGPVDTGACTA
jgi:S1-C subfamily serine protease